MWGATTDMGEAVGWIRTPGVIADRGDLLQRPPSTSHPGTECGSPTLETTSARAGRESGGS